MDSISKLGQRRSTRHFSDIPVSQGLLDLILSTAVNSSPSAVNQQAYHFYVINDKTLINELASKSLESLVSHGFNVSQYKCFTQTKSDDIIFYDAPVIIVVTIPKTGSKSQAYVLFDAGVISQTIMLTAHLLGLGTIPVTCTSFVNEYILRRIGAGENEEICVAISLGWPDKDAHPINFSKKKTASELTTWITSK